MSITILDQRYAADRCIACWEPAMAAWNLRADVSAGCSQLPEPCLRGAHEQSFASSAMVWSPVFETGEAFRVSLGSNPTPSAEVAAQSARTCHSKARPARRIGARRSQRCPGFTVRTSYLVLYRRRDPQRAGLVRSPSGFCRGATSSSCRSTRSTCPWTSGRPPPWTVSSPSSSTPPAPLCPQRPANRTGPV